MKISNKVDFKINVLGYVAIRFSKIIRYCMHESAFIE